MDAKKALEATNGDLPKAVEHLRKTGQKIAAQKSARAVKEGVVGEYVHANKKVAALVAVACETDFVALTNDFQQLAHDLAMHVAAANPQYLAPENVPADIVAKEEEVAREQLRSEGKPEQMWDKIIPGKLNKFYSDVCLTRQLFVKDDSKTIEDLVKEYVVKLGENIQITSFSRLSV